MCTRHLHVQSQHSRVIFTPWWQVIYNLYGSSRPRANCGSHFRHRWNTWLFFTHLSISRYWAAPKIQSASTKELVIYQSTTICTWIINQIAQSGIINFLIYNGGNHWWLTNYYHYFFPFLHVSTFLFKLFLFNSICPFQFNSLKSAFWAILSARSCAADLSPQREISLAIHSLMKEKMELYLKVFKGRKVSFHLFFHLSCILSELWYSFTNNRESFDSFPFKQNLHCTNNLHSLLSKLPSKFLFCLFNPNILLQ